MKNEFLTSLLLGASLVFWGFSAQAEATKKHALDIELQACIDQDGSTLGMKQCHWDYQKKWDGELNRFYQLLGGDRNTELKNAQLAWMRLRDAEWKWIEARYAQIYKDSGGGTMWGLLATADKMEVVRKRALELRQFYLFKHCDMTGDCDSATWGQ